MDTKELLKKVRKIEIKTRHLSDAVFGGEYHSAFKGRGMTFSEVRQYQYGDDVRNIDWNVTARYNEPFIKVFEEERELTMMLAADISGSGLFGTKDNFKSDIITEICATLAFSATVNNDKVGLLLFSDQVELYIPPKKGRSHVLRIIRDLIELKPKSKKTNISSAMEFLMSVLKKRSILFVLSDFISTDYQRKIQLLNKRHDLTGIRVYDRCEKEIPNLGVVQMLDEETGKSMWVDTTSKKIRESYRHYHTDMVDYFKESFVKSGAGIIDVEVNDSYVKKLYGYFKSL